MYILKHNISIKRRLLVDMTILFGTGNEHRVKIYKHTDSLSDWAQGTFRQLIAADVVKADAAGEIAVQECSV